jgi:hypothetical protein
VPTTVLLLQRARGITATRAGVHIGTRVFAVVGTEPTLRLKKRELALSQRGWLQVAVGCPFIRPPRIL